MESAKKRSSPLCVCGIQPLSKNRLVRRHENNTGKSASFVWTLRSFAQQQAPRLFPTHLKCDSDSDTWRQRCGFGPTGERSTTYCPSISSKTQVARIENSAVCGTRGSGHLTSNDCKGKEVKIKTHTEACQSYKLFLFNCAESGWQHTESPTTCSAFQPLAPTLTS